jgi:hypothetical protein
MKRHAKFIKYMKKNLIGYERKIMITYLKKQRVLDEWEREVVRCIIREYRRNKRVYENEVTIDPEMIDYLPKKRG